MSDQKINNGGPAFPTSVPATTDARIGFAGDEIPVGHTAHYGGLTMRDYFAAKAMLAQVSALSDWAAGSEDAWHAEVARLAYATADAMLKAREGGAA